MRSGNSRRRRFNFLLFLASSFYLAAIQQGGQFAVASESTSQQVGDAAVGDVVLRYRACLLRAKLDHLNLWQHATRLPDANETSLLAEVRSQPVEQRMRTLDQFLAAPDSDTLPIEYVVHAVVGMDSRLRHQAIEKSIRPVLSRIAADSAQRRASIRAAMELDAYDEIDEFSSVVVPFLAGSASDFQEGDRGAARCWGLSFERATNASLPGERRKLSDLLLQTDHKWNSSMQGIITQFLAPELATMDQEQLQKREVRILQALSWRPLKYSSPALWSKLERNGVRTDSFRSYNERDRKEAAQDAERLAAELRKPGNSTIAFQNYFNLSTAVAGLPNDARRHVAEQLLAQVRKSVSWDSPISLGPPLAALAEEFSPDETVEIVRRYFELDARQRIAPYLVDELPAGLIFLGKLPPANAVTVTRYLSTQKGWLPVAAMRTVAGRLPMDQRVALIGPLRESFVAGNDESALAISAIAKPLNDGLRAKGIAWLIRLLNEAVPAEGDCSAESLVRGGICAAAAAELSPESQAARGAFDRLFGAFLRSHVAGAKDQIHSGAGMRLTPSVQRGLTALLKCMSNADRKQAVHSIAAIVKSAAPDGRRSALVFALADSAAVLDEPQAEEVMQAFAPMLEGETNQLSNSGYAVRRFLDARPDREQAKHVVTIARVYLTRTLESNAASGVINTGELGATLGDRLPSQEALTTFQQLLTESAKMGRNGGPFLEAIARRIRAKDQPQAAQSVKKYLQDTDNGLLAVGLVQCLAAMPHSLGPADCPAVVNRVLEIHDHLATERGRTDFRERNPPRLIASMLEYQLLRMAANVDAPTDPAFVSLLAPSIQQVCTGHPIGVAELMPSIERIRGTMKRGVAPRMFTEATAEGNVRNNKAFVFAGLADRIPQDEKAECFQIAWKWIQTLNSGPPELPNRSRRGNIMDAYDAPAGVAVGRLATTLTGSARTSVQQELDAILANKFISAKGVWAAAIASELLVQDATTNATGLAARIEQLRPLLGENTGRALYGRVLVNLPAPARAEFLKEVVPPFVKKALPPSVKASDEVTFFIVEVFRALSVVERARFIDALRGQRQLNQSQLINLAGIHRISGPLPTREDLADVGNVGIKRMILLVGSEQSGERWMGTSWDYMNNSTNVRRSGRLR